MQGNCSEQPGEELYAEMGLQGAPLLPLKARQCLVVGDQRFLDTSRGDSDSEATELLDISRLWLDGLYLRYKRTPRAPDGCAQFSAIPPRSFLSEIGTSPATNREYICLTHT